MMDIRDCCALYTSNGDVAFAIKDYDRAVELYSAAIDLGSATDAIFASRCDAKLGKTEWEDVVVDAQKVRWCLWFRSPSSLTILVEEKRKRVELGS